MIIRRVNVYEARTPSNASFKKEAEWLVKDNDKQAKGKVLSRPAVYRVFDDLYFYMNGSMGLLSDYDLGIGEPVESEQLENIIDKATRECTQEVNLPDLIDLTQYIKNDVERQKQNWTPGYITKTKTFHKDRTFYDFSKDDTGLPLVNAEYLKHMLNALGSNIKCYVSGKPLSPLYFTGSNGDGILMPIRR